MGISTESTAVRFFPPLLHHHRFEDEELPERLPVKCEGQWLLLENSRPDHRPLLEGVSKRIFQTDSYQEMIFSVSLKKEGEGFRPKIKAAKIEEMQPRFFPFETFVAERNEGMPKRLYLHYSFDIAGCFPPSQEKKGTTTDYEGFVLLKQGVAAHRNLFKQFCKKCAQLDEKTLEIFSLSPYVDLTRPPPVKAVSCAEIALSLCPFKKLEPDPNIYSLKELVPFKRTPLQMHYFEFKTKIAIHAQRLYTEISRQNRVFRSLSPIVKKKRTELQKKRKEAEEALKKLSPPVSEKELERAADETTKIVRNFSLFYEALAPEELPPTITEKQRGQILFCRQFVEVIGSSQSPLLQRCNARIEKCSRFLQKHEIRGKNRP